MVSISEVIKQLEAAADGASGDVANVPVDLLRDAAKMLAIAKERDRITWSEATMQQTVGKGY